MTLLDSETSLDGAAPVYLYDWNADGTHYRRTSQDTSWTFDGNTYLPAARLSHAPVVRQGIGDSSSDLEIEIAASDALVIALFAAQMPVSLTVRISKVQPGGDAVWVDAKVAGVAKRGETASFRCVTYLDDDLERAVPGKSVSRRCGNFLGDRHCRKDLTSLLHTTTVAASVNLTTLTVSSIGGHPDHYFRYGVLRSGTSKVMIVSQIGTTLILFGAHGLAPGAAVELTPGCDGKIQTCVDTFDNRVNFFGAPNIPPRDVFRFGLSVLRS